MLDPISLLTDYGWAGLLLVTFLAASIVPFPSDPAIVAAVGFMPLEVVFLVSMVGGTLGSITNYFIGSRGLHWLWFHKLHLGGPHQEGPHKETGHEKRARKLFEKYGYYAIVFAPIIPFVGDPLMIVAGALRPNFTKFIIAITIGRVAKNLLLIYFGTALFKFLGF